MNEKNLRLAVISGASHALKYKAENPRATEQEVMQHIADKAQEIIEKIDEDL